MPTRDPEAIVAAWCELDRAGAVLAADRDIVDTTRSVRRVIAEFALAGGADEEIFDACASLGRLIAQGGGSPTLASLTIDHASVALGALGRAWITPGRAAVAEGFTLGLLERVQRDALRSWDFPRCAVLMPGGVVAIAAGLPSDDPELLREWAGLIAKGAALEGVRQAFVAGPDAPRAAVEDALDLVGIRVVTR
jgi:hypothetical protein